MWSLPDLHGLDTHDLVGQYPGLLVAASIRPPDSLMLLSNGGCTVAADFHPARDGTFAGDKNNTGKALR